MVRANISDRTRLYLAAGIILLGFSVVLCSYWPGIMIDDARWQYQQAVDNLFEDWHPPLMAWIWRRLMFLKPGPAPMFVLQLSLYWIGIASIAGAAYRRGQAQLCVPLALAGFIPATFALSGTITKDCLMAAILGCAVGLSLWADAARRPKARYSLLAGTLLLLLAASALRFNAFLACLPLALAVLPPVLVSTRSRLVVTALVATALFLVSGPVVSKLVGARNMDTDLSLILFDLGGITEYSGVSQFPDMQVADPVETNHHCYNHTQWDSYSSWARRPCPLNFERFRSTLAARHLSPIKLWIGAVLTHPLAYAEHRLTHFNRSIWFIYPYSPGFTGWSVSAPNPWNYKVEDNIVLRSVTRITNFVASGPIGWPVFWMALSLAALIIARSARMDRLMVGMAASPLLYGMGYLVFGVATGMRYHLWTIIGAAIAALLILGRSNEATTRARIAAALAVAVPTLMAAIAGFL